MLIPAVTCPSLSIPSDGQIGYSLAVQVNGEFLVGTVATFTCSGGFELVGDTVRECESDSSWTNIQPSCLSKCKCQLSDYSHGSCWYTAKEALTIY